LMKCVHHSIKPHKMTGLQGIKFGAAVT